MTAQQIQASQPLGAVKQAQAPRPLIWAAFIGWAILFIVGVAGVYLRLTEQLRPTDLGSYVTWGLWISVDIYFIGLSAGAFLLSSFVYIFRVKALEPLGKLALFTAVVCLLMAMLSAWFDLGHMERFWYVFWRPNFRSIMTLMVWLYMAYLILLFVEIWLAARVDLIKCGQGSGFKAGLCKFLAFGSSDVSETRLQKDHRLLQVLGGIGVVLAVTFHGGMGALFATLVARPYWNGALYPIFFLTGALVSGTALVLAMTAFIWPHRNEVWRGMTMMLSRIMVILLLFDILLEWAEFSIPAWYGVGGELDALKEVLFGPYWYVFWIFHILLGAVIPIALVVFKPRSPFWLGTAGLLTVLTYMAVRLNIVIPGLITPQLSGLGTAFFDPRLKYEYLPTLTEWQVSLFVAMLGVALFYAGYRLLPLVSSKEEA